MKCQECNSKGMAFGCPVCGKIRKQDIRKDALFPKPEKSRAEIVGRLISMDKYKFIQGALIAEIVEDVMKIQKGEV